MRGFIFSPIKRHTVLYVDISNNLATRLGEHKSKQNLKSVSARYNINKLIYYEGFGSIAEVTAREKYIKGRPRKWKEALIQEGNREWIDLSGIVKAL